MDFSLFKEHEVVFLEAFTHRSAVNESSTIAAQNERLEFLGDAVLELVVTEFLFQNFPDKPEGDMTNFRSALVKKETLAKVARNLEMGLLLSMSKGEERSGGREKDYLLANLLEAFIGAIYLSGGYKLTQKFVKNFILVELDEILEHSLYIDAKSEFQEVTQGDFGITPSYSVLDSFGKDHDKTFVLGAFLEKQKVGEGKGHSKKEAQIEAAENALKNISEWKSLFPRKK
ncbi:ribonuclease III [Candidatus Gracilibacteria bacterium]|nr:ribonuclease III [Candidatus Gracilibacteria bacterium]